MALKLPKKDDSQSTPTLDTSSLAKRIVPIEELLIFATENNCSDVYITLTKVPYVSKFGKIIKLPCFPVSKENWTDFYTNYVLNEDNSEFVVQKTFDSSIEVRIPEDNPNYEKYFYYRYRVSFGFSRRNKTAIFRMIKPQKPTFDNINYNPQCIEALTKAYSEKTGICIETGPTGSGKSTTLAACINTFTQPNNVLDNKVIITLEDPIENEFDSTDSVLIVQKELGTDFLSFGAGIKSALREHPNVIIVGEMRDREVICTAIEAGRTGHLVSTTFHAADVGGTISRILYHLDNDKNLSFDLLMQLNIVISQRMLKRDNKYLVDTQYLLFTDEITKKLIKVIENQNLTVAIEIENMIKDPELQRLGLAKDWDYPNEV